VRDRIPEIIHKSGNECEFVISGRNTVKLLPKLIDRESGRRAHEQDLVAELADLYEVIDADGEFWHFGRSTFVEQLKRQQRGFAVCCCGHSENSLLICVYLPLICSYSINQIIQLKITY